MEAFDYVVALKIFAAGSLVYGAVLFILIRFQRAFLFQSLAYFPHSRSQGVCERALRDDDCGRRDA